MWRGGGASMNIVDFETPRRGEKESVSGSGSGSGLGSGAGVSRVEKRWRGQFSFSAFFSGPLVSEQAVSVSTVDQWSPVSRWWIVSAPSRGRDDCKPTPSLDEIHRFGLFANRFVIATPSSVVSRWRPNCRPLPAPPWRRPAGRTSTAEDSTSTTGAPTAEDGKRERHTDTGCAQDPRDRENTPDRGTSDSRCPASTPGRGKIF